MRFSILSFLSSRSKTQRSENKKMLLLSYGKSADFSICIFIFFKFHSLQFILQNGFKFRSAILFHFLLPFIWKIGNGFLIIISLSLLRIIIIIISKITTLLILHIMWYYREQWCWYVYCTVYIMLFTLCALLCVKLSQTLLLCAVSLVLVYNMYVPAIIICIYFVIMCSNNCVS